MTRLEALQQYYKDEPGDPFNLYALALEYQKTDGPHAAHLFAQLLNEHPSYLPAYYHYGNLLNALQRDADAVAIIQKGVSLAREQKELKAMRELQALLDDWED